MMTKPGFRRQGHGQRQAQYIINGESRPLDVPPEIYKGTVVVPVRVISEGMGAYVQWVPEKKVVVVRYIAAPVPTPPPTRAADGTADAASGSAADARTAAAAAGHAPAPTPAPPSRVYEHFIVGDYIFKPQVFNQLSNGSNTATWGPSFAGRAAIEFPIGNIPFMIEGYGEQYAYTPSGRRAAQQYALRRRSRRQSGVRNADRLRHRKPVGSAVPGDQ